MRDLVDMGRRCFGSTAEMEASVNDTQLPSLQPEQAVPVRVRNACGLESEAAFEHG